MKFNYLKCCLGALLLTLSAQSFAQQAKHTFAQSNTDFLLDGKPYQMISGEMHCARIPREYWRDRIRKAKAMGLNTIGTYVFWNAHEPHQGKFDFNGNNDIAEFVKIAQQEGMWVVMRPSPYVCAEWEFGGYPWWLLKDPTLKVRSMDPKFLKAYKSYMTELAKQLVPLQITHGGNILMIQIENEYGSYSDDRVYLDMNRKIFREVGFDVDLFTCDPAKDYSKGFLPGYLPAVNGLDKPDEVKALVNKYNGGKGPYYIAEWYPGWFDDWGKPHQKRSADDAAARLDKVLAAGISINMYMFHGGTTRDFMNGANFNDKKPYAPQVSSYDYDAPLDEAGNATDKFMKFRAVIEKYLPKGTTLPPVPVKTPTIAIPEIKLTEYASILTGLSESPRDENVKTFEDLDQGYGFVVYRNILAAGGKGWLKIDQLRDFATVYINGKHVGTLDRRLKLDSLMINAPAGAKLDIVTENNGRINFGPYLIDNRHGITNKVTFNGIQLRNWLSKGFPFTDVRGIKYKKGTTAEVQPALYHTTFNLAEVGDTYLDMAKFGKGFVFLNGHNLGKYWNIGPQQTIYVPSSWLRKGANDIVVFDALKSGHTSINAVQTAELDKVIAANEAAPVAKGKKFRIKLKHDEEQTYLYARHRRLGHRSDCACLCANK